MSIELVKIVQIYQQSIDMLSATSQLFVSDSSRTLKQNLSNNKTNKNAFQVWTIYIEESLQKIINVWLNKYSMFQEFQSINDSCINQLTNKMLSIKNNSSLLSKQGQLIADIQSQIKNWTSIGDPLIYYDIKKRESFKNQLKQKMSQVKQNSPVTKQSQSPVYMKKLQQQLKRTIYSVYLSQVSIKKGMKQIASESWETISKTIRWQDKQIRNLKLFSYIYQQKTRFFQVFGETLLNKKNKMNQTFFENYFKQVCALMKNISKFWHNFSKTLAQIIYRIYSYSKKIQVYKQDFSRREGKFLKLLQKTTPSINKIFDNQIPIRSTACLNQIFQILPVLTKFGHSLEQFKSFTQKNYKQSEEYYNRVISQYQSRRKDPYFYTIDDKTFIEANNKTQYIANKKIIELYSKLLSQCYDISNNTRQIFADQYLVLYQSHQIGSILSRQIKMLDQGSSRNTMFSKSQFSTNHSEIIMKNKPKIKNQQLSQIQKFQNQIYIFDSTGINWNRNNIFSCALGPRLLLHGSLAILQEGLYFQSLFNKKNLFFGRTRLFIPRAQIIQIGNYNKMAILPNFIQVKTKAGALYFYSVSNRITIENTLNEAYFPENSPNSQQLYSEVDFKEYQESLHAKYTEKQINQILKPYENVIVDKVFKDTKLKKFFKRYFSDDSFQTRGQKYENFRTYFLLQIEAIQPKCTPLIPDPPSYFTYKSQKQNQKNFPKTSQRLHTYKKIIPNIPFLSSGGEGLCQDKQTYYWISPTILVIDLVSKVKGFSLIQSMQIHAKIVIKQQENNINFTQTTGVRFLTQASTNKLVKGPALNNLKDVILKMIQIIQKYQKGKKNRSSQGKNNSTQQNQTYQQNIAKLLSQNQKLKKKFDITIIVFVIVYILTILVFTLL